MAFSRIEHSGAAVQTTLASGIGSGDTSLSLADATNWPTGAVGPFYLVIDPYQTTAEVVLATARSGTSLTGLTRGRDGFSAAIHAAGVPVLHILPALEADEANQVVKATLGTVTTKGDGLFATGAGALARVAAGSNGLPLVANSGASAGVNYAQLATAGIADAAVTADKIAAAVAGNGLAGGAGTALSVGVDGSTLELSSDQVRVKDGGIVIAKFGTGLRPNFRVADATALAALTPSSGDVAYQVDTKRYYAYDGAAWIFQDSLASGEGRLIFTSATVTGTATSGGTEKTLATINLASAHKGYRLEAAAHWTAICAGTAGDQFDFRIKVAGITAATVRHRFPAGAGAWGNAREFFAIPSIPVTDIAASTATAVIVTIQRTTGSTDSINTEVDGALTTTQWF